MKRKNTKKYFYFAIIMLFISLIILIVFLNRQKPKYKTTNKEENNKNDLINEETTLKEDISILLPKEKDKCDVDECILSYTKKQIYEYFKNNNYEKIIKDTSIYYKNSSILIKIDESDKDIIKEEKSKYDHYFNRYTTLDDLIKIINGQNINIYTGTSAKEIAVLNFHFFYDSKKEKCNEIICLSTSNFEKQLNYLKENNYKTLTIEEYTSWIYEEIDLPEKSVLLTIDDGAMGTSKINGNKLIPLLEKYEVNATLFLITGWWKKENYESEYLDIQSHTNLMHDDNICSNKTRGAEMLCSNKETIKNDLSKSLKLVDSNTSFCYPFYLYDNKSIEVLKELGFKIAFIGGNRKSNQKNNKYTIPRYIIYKDTTLNSFINMIN